MRELLVFGDRTFKISIPDDAKVTFGPWSPPPKDRSGWQNEERRGTLRIYKNEGAKENGILACFAGVTGFRDLSIGYAEEVAREEGATIWKSDEHGYMREDKRSGSREWVVPTLPAPADDDGFSADNPDDNPF